MKTSEIFQACIPLIKSREKQFICHAVYAVIFGDKQDEEWTKQIRNESLRHPLCKIVHEKIDNEDHVFDYLYVKELPHTVADCRVFRLQLLESLVLEYQAKGD